MEVKWYEWCRLCAGSGASFGGQNIDLSSVPNSTSICTAIGKYFWVNIKPCDLNKYICQDCYMLIHLLVDFTERVNKVQAMFLMLQSTKSSQLDPFEVRSQFDLLDEDWQHIIKSERRNIEFDYVRELETIENDEMEGSYSEINSKECHKSENLAAPATFFIYDTDNDHLKDLKDSENQFQKLEAKIKDKVLKISNREDQKPEKGGIRLENEEIELERENYIEDDKEFQEMVNQVATEKDRKESHGDTEHTALSNFKKLQGQADEAAESSNAPRYQCKSCGKNYKNATSYRKHLESHNLVSDLCNFICDECGKVLATERQLVQHKRIHLPLEEKLTVQCPHCEKKYSNEAVMKHHVVHMHTEQSFVCDECGVSLKRLSSLKDHKLTHTNILAFKCESCDKGFKNRARLKAHMDAVHSTTTYQCPQCDLNLNSKRTLKMHMLVHTNEKGYKCNFCEAEFKRGKSLKNHLIIHIGLRPYKCNFCEKTFTNGSNCRAHKKKIHPLELKAEEAAGLRHSGTIVPNLYELRASESVQEPRSSARIRNGITPRMAALLVAAEQLGTTKETVTSNMPNDASESIQQIDNESSEFQEDTDITTENDSKCFEQEIEGETLVFEVIDEEDDL